MKRTKTEQVYPSSFKIDIFFYNVFYFRSF